MIDVPNKILHLEVNNPFYFPLLGINTVGTGEIKGICSAAKGSLAGSVRPVPSLRFHHRGSVGVGGVEQWHILRSSANHARCMHQSRWHHAVGLCRSFPPTDRGIMLISGSQTQCISEAINSEYPFDATSCQASPSCTPCSDMSQVPTSACPHCRSRSSSKKCQMIYDYVHQRVIVCAPPSHTPMSIR